MYNPKAVVSTLLKGKFRSYWSETGSYETIVPLISMNFDGLKSAIIEMLSGNSVKVDPKTFHNDTVSFQNRDDVLTYMIHLGYLAYDQSTQSAYIPNEEIRQELSTTVKSTKWSELISLQNESERLLNATLDMNCDAVAAGIEKIHMECVSTIQYNNENSLSSVLTIAYLGVMQYYFKPIREMPAGRVFADFVFVPKTEYREFYPAIVAELKRNQHVSSATIRSEKGNILHH